MKKVLLNYDEAGGNIYDGNGNFVCVYTGVLNPVEPENQQTKSSIDEIIALNKAGFSAAEIIELKQSRLI